MPNLDTLLSTQNICSLLEDEELTKIGSLVCRDYLVDLNSMSEWLERNEKAGEIIDHTFGNKSDPWPGAANTKIPLVLNSAIRFQSESGAEIIKGTELVKTEIFGEDPDNEKAKRAGRVKAHMNYQLFHEMENWEEDMDQLLLAVSLLGCVHKKVFFNKVKGSNESQLCISNVVINNAATTPRTRVTQTFTADKNEIYEKVLLGEWKKIDYTSSETEDGESEDDGVQSFYEQHRRIDLDEDGYEEPYIVVVHEKTEQVVSVQANFKQEDIDYLEEKILRINPSCEFVKYGFIPSTDGSYWALGWGILLGPLNDNVNAIVNQLLDAGTLANLQGGWIDARIKTVGGDNRFKPGEYKRMRSPGGMLKDGIVPMVSREPSQTLFVLLELLIQQAKEFTSVTDIMQGEQPQANMSASSVIALIEQGKKTFNSIYKRMYRSLKKEFKKLFALNAVYTDPKFYQMLLDMEADFQADYASLGWDIAPTANPEFSSRIQRLANVEALMVLRGDPNVDQREIARRYVQALEIDNPEKLVPEQPEMTPEQKMQELEVMKQEMMDGAEVQTKQLSAEIKALEKEIMELKLAQTQAEAPEKVESQVEKTNQAELKTVEAQRRIELIEEQIAATKAQRQYVTDNAA